MTAKKQPPPSNQPTPQRPAFVAIGANLPAPGYKTPRAGAEAAIKHLGQHPNVTVIQCSNWYRSPAFPPSDQPDYVNAVFSIMTSLDAGVLLTLLHQVEADYGRRRSRRNAARTLDLDLLDYDGLICNSPSLPHPRLHRRLFVLRPLAELAPDWQHPVTGCHVQQLIKDADPATEAAIVRKQI